MGRAMNQEAMIQGVIDGPGSNRRSDGWYKRLIRLQFIGMRQDEGIINYNL